MTEASPETGAVTPLDTAHAAMQAAPEDDAARLRFFERLADSELYLLLTEEARDENLSPETFDLEEGPVVLAFDREERLAQFAETRAAPYAALSGRVLARMLAGQGVGLGLNLGVAPSSILLPAAALGWLTETLGRADPAETRARIAELAPPRGLPAPLLDALDARLASAAGLAQMAYLAAVTYGDGGRGHLLAFIGAEDRARPALARAAAEALTFSGIEAGAMDVGFFAADEPITARLAAAALRIDLPPPQPPRRAAPKAPGSDPDRPPILK